MPVPAYRFDPTLAFPEIPRIVDSKGNRAPQCTTDCQDVIAGVTLAMAYYLGGQKFEGTLASLTAEQIYKEVSVFCSGKLIRTERLLDWAESINIPYEDTLTTEEKSQYVPTEMEGVGFSLDQYQIDVAAWNALRLGSIQALGCGIGKSATATAAAITAARIERCSTSRCYIVCPLNAVPQWQPYLIDLKKTFKTVDVVTVDSLHLIQGLERDPGGALIIDEAHKLKNYGAQRTNEAHALRPAFEWAVCLTGTLLHTGPEGVMSVQDLACPGLSRFMDKWAFGSAFNCIVNKKILTHNGYINRRSLVIPSKENEDVLQKYLSRGVRSLRFESPEVKKVFTIPEHQRLTISKFPKSGWQESLRFPELVKDSTYEDMIERQVEYLNPADTSIKIMAPALAVAIMIEDREQHDIWLAGITEEERPYIPEGKLAYPGLPAFAAVLHRVVRFGWEDIALKLCKFWVDENKSVEVVGYRFARPEGNSEANPAIGPKLLWLNEWFENNPEEPIVIGAAAVDTLNLVQAVLVQKKVSYRLIRGGVSNNDRKIFIEDYQAGKYQVMLLQQVAGSESVTLTKSRRSILIDHDFNPISYTQFIHRVYRRGQKQKTEHYDLVLNDVQASLLTKLKKGEAFDSSVREQIEKAIGFAVFKENFLKGP